MTIDESESSHSQVQPSTIDSTTPPQLAQKQLHPTLVNLSIPSFNPSSNDYHTLLPQTPPRPSTPPHRKLPPQKPIKSILKPSPQPQPKFNFKRDILNPFSNKLGYAALEESPFGSVVGAGGSSVGQGVQAAAGWVGNAWKRLGGVTITEKARVDDPDHPQNQPQDQSHHNLTNSSHSPTSFVHSTTQQPLLSPNSTSHVPLVSSPNSKFNHLPFSSSTEPSHNLNQTNALAPPLHLPHPTSNHLQLSISSLKKVHFIMSDLKIIYPISNTQPPSFDQLNKSRINQARKLVIHNRTSSRHHSPSSHQDPSVSSSPNVNGWTARNLELFYDECCRTREEGWGLMKVREILKQFAPLPPQMIDLTGIPLNRMGTVEVLGDLLSVDFGLKSLVLSDCSLEDHHLKPILHGLLVSGNLPSLSLANNPKLRAKGWKLIAVFVKKAKALRNLDLSHNSLDRHSIEYIVQAIAGNIRRDHLDVPTSSSSASFNVSGHSPAFTASPSSNILISPPPPTHTSVPTVLSPSSTCNSRSDSAPHPPENEYKSGASTLFPSAPLLREDVSPALQALSAISNWPCADASNIVSLRLDGCNLKNSQLDSLAHGIRFSKLKHVSLRNNHIMNLGAVALAFMIKDWPTQNDSVFNDGFNGKVDLSSDHKDQTIRLGNGSPEPSLQRAPAHFESLNSVTTRQSDLLAHQQLQTMNSFVKLSPQPSSESQTEYTPGVNQAEVNPTHNTHDLSTFVKEEMKTAHIQRSRMKSKIDQLPRIGQLLTLDVKCNDLRGSDMLYLSQILKKNRTLKVLNLAENRIDAAGLVHLAAALRNNTALETLDLSRNPCCGPTLEGILALRTTCTINNSLKRIFLSRTELSSQGSIAIAEFLPEMKSLIHLDLTENHGIDIAGVMALAVAVKMNTSLRCLDINIPPNDPDFAYLSQDILQSCVRNTELAQQAANQVGTRTTIAQPMLKSTVVKALAHHQGSESSQSKHQIESPATQTKLRNSNSSHLSETIRRNLDSTETTCNVLRELIFEDEQRKIRLLQEGRKVPMVVECSELVRELLDQVKAGQIQIKEALDNIIMDEALRTQASSVHIQSIAVSDYAVAVYKEQERVNLDLISSKSLPSSEEIPLFEASRNHSVEAQNAESSIPNPGLDTEDEQEASTTNTSTRSSQSGTQPLESTRSTPEPTLQDAFHEKLRVIPESVQSDQSPIRLSSPSSTASPRSPVESHSRSLTIEEGEVFRKGTVLGTVIGDEDEEIPGDVLKESILIAQVDRTKRSSINREGTEEVFPEQDHNQIRGDEEPAPESSSRE